MSLVHRVEELVDEQGNALVGKAEHWERVPLHLVATVINGFPFPSGGFNTTEGEPVIRIRDVTSGQVGTYFKGSVANAPKVHHGDLVLGMDGDFNSRLWSGDTAFMNQRVCKVIPDDQYYSKALLAYVIPGYLKLVNDHTSAITVKHLSSRTVQDLPLPLPPRLEQDRLVSKLDELFSRIDEGERALERVQKLVERYRQSVLKAAVTGELTREWRETRGKSDAPIETGEALLARILTVRREAWERAELGKMKTKGIKPKDDKWKVKYEEAPTLDAADFSPLPDGWTWASLNQTCHLHPGLGFPKHLQGKTEGKYPFYKVSDISRCVLEGRTKLTDAPHNIDEAVLVGLRGKIVPEGTVVFARIGEGLKLERRAMTSMDSLVDNNVIGVKSAGVIQDDYLYFVLKTVRMGGLARATTVPAVRSTDIAAIPIAVPPQDEQQQIVDKVQLLLQQADLLTAELTSRTRALSRLRNGILKSAFSGCLVSQDAADEPAPALLARISAERFAAPYKSKRYRNTKKVVTT